MKYFKLIYKNTENETGTVMLVITSVLWDTTLCKPIYNNRRLGTACSYDFSVAQKVFFRIWERDVQQHSNWGIRRENSNTKREREREIILSNETVKD